MKLGVEQLYLLQVWNGQWQIGQLAVMPTLKFELCFFVLISPGAIILLPYCLCRRRRKYLQDIVIIEFWALSQLFIEDQGL
jgi:hypothetical protein